MTTYEGGPRVPFISQWNGHWPSGKVYENPVMNLDVVPTMMAATGHKIAQSEKLDGVDLAPFLTGQNSGRPHQTMYWRFGPQWPISNGPANSD